MPGEKRAVATHHSPEAVLRADATERVRIAMVYFPGLSVTLAKVNQFLGLAMD